MTPSKTSSAEQAKTVTTEDGYIVDIETGERVGLVEPQETFAVVDIDSANWVLNKKLEAQAEMDAIDSSAIVLHARTVLANAEELKKVPAGKLSFLAFRYDKQLEDFARAQLVGQKGRTWKSFFGSVAFRKVKGKLKVKNADKALAVAQVVFPNAVKKVEEFQISKLTDEQIEELRNIITATVEVEQKGESVSELFLNARDGFELTSDREEVDIKAEVKS